MTSARGHVRTRIRLGPVRAGLAALVCVCGAWAADAVAQDARDRVALEALYRATRGANWTNNSNWLSGEPLSTWYGVTTDADGRVVALALRWNALTGRLPPAVGDLTRLRVLDLGQILALIGMAASRSPPASEIQRVNDTDLLFQDGYRNRGRSKVRGGWIGTGIGIGMFVALIAAAASTDAYRY